MWQRGGWSTASGADDGSGGVLAPAAAALPPAVVVVGSCGTVSHLPSRSHGTTVSNVVTSTGQSLMRSRPRYSSLAAGRSVVALCAVCEAICPCLVPLGARLTLFCCSFVCGHTQSRPVRRDAALLFPSCTRINVSNVRRLSQSTVVVVVHGRRPPPSPLTEATALDTLPENDQAHSSAVQLITPFDNPTSFSDVAATTDSSSSSSSTT
ncbi:hypothetical protein AGLY_016100 [Aphis glycines]|uniref:Uncharacterized protein n=1 Tax=Aphis glycines TaxID=307491 RepID=A0A6G0SZH1_APHGL|nr:hypothetical protein AGLY_016100 [Aphis glycines]